jgi:aryl-alcohol dehydrogenase-like predicted oxidoreductase
MNRRSLGATGLQVAPLGFGAGHIGSPTMTEQEVGTLLNRAVDRGINLIDTARGYGLSEERIGRHLSWRRGDVVLVSKCGYGVPNVEDWTPQAIYAGVDMALRLMNTDYIDVMLFHSCPAKTLRRPGLIDALEDCVRAGKIRYAGYSGENDDLAFALSTRRFAVIETSVNVFDQRVLLGSPIDLPTSDARAVEQSVAAQKSILEQAVERGVGVIAKRPLANVPWKYLSRPVGEYVEPYWQRMHAMNVQPLIDNSGLTWEQVALRFAAFAPGVSTAIVGTSNIANLERNIAIVHEGALPVELTEALHKAFRQHDDDWVGQI